MKAPKAIICTVCGSNLMHGEKGWVCPTCGFYFVVRRGKAGAPLLEPPKGIVEKPAGQAPTPPASAEETFEKWRERHGGVTDEMYEGLDDKTKWELKMAYSQRHKKDADFVMLPPQR